MPASPKDIVVGKTFLEHFLRVGLRNLSKRRLIVEALNTTYFMRLSVQGLPCWICSAFTLPSSHSLFETGQAVTVTIPRAGFQFFHFLQPLGGDHPGKVLRFHERTNFDVGVFGHRVREFLHPVNRFLE